MRITGIGSGVIAQNIILENSNINLAPFFTLSGLVSQCMLSNFEINNVTLDTSNTIIDVELANIILIDTVSFNDIRPLTQSTTDVFMITFTAIDISTGTASAIQGITVTNSTIGFLKIIGLYSDYVAGSMLAVQNITIHD